MLKNSSPLKRWYDSIGKTTLTGPRSLRWKDLQLGAENLVWCVNTYHMGIYKKPRPFNHIFGGDRILRAWYRGIKNAGPRKRAQGRAQDIPYQSISPYHHGIWRIFIECGEKTHARKSAQGRSARGPILPKSNRNFRQPPYVYLYLYIHSWRAPTRKWWVEVF